MELTQQQIEEVKRVKMYFPYRIAFGALHPKTQEFRASAATTKRPINDLLRQGWLVWQL